MGYNSKRAAAMKRKSMEELKKIIESGALSSAAAEYEMMRRLNENKETPKNAKA